MDLSRHMLTLRFSGLSSFGQNVVFADVIEKERLERMAGRFFGCEHVSPYLFKLTD